MAFPPSLRRLTRRWAGDRRGGLAVGFAIAAPVIALLTCGVVDLVALRSSRTAFQDAADAAAINAAKQLGLSDVAGLQPRAEAFIASQVITADKGVRYQVATSVSPDEPTVTVKIDGVRDSFFGNLLPPGGWKLHVQSTATRVNQAPLCVLSTGADGSNMIRMKDGAQLTAPKCLIHSNGDIEVSNSGWLQAAVAQSVGTATGRISPEPQTDAPAIADPFATLNIDTGTCPLLGGVGALLGNIVHLLPGLNNLAPGTYCGDITVESGMTLNLKGGDYRFKQGQLKLKKGSKLIGDNVVLIFDKDADFKFGETSEINLSGRRTGTLAGFVIATTPQNNHTFEISTTSARKLLGTVYIPNATLRVSGTANKVSDQADWTVIVAKDLQMEGTPNLVLNTNYGGSPVPVPTGVGPMGSVRLR